MSQQQELGVLIQDLRSGKNDRTLQAIDKLRKLDLLSDGSLAGVNLWGANLAGANMQRANLIGVNLSAANLSGVDFRLACLNKVRLAGADLRGANLSNAQLMGTSLNNSTCDETTILPSGEHWTPDVKFEMTESIKVHLDYNDR